MTDTRESSGLVERLRYEAADGHAPNAALLNEAADFIERTPEPAEAVPPTLDDLITMLKSVRPTCNKLSHEWHEGYKAGVNGCVIALDCVRPDAPPPPIAGDTVSVPREAIDACRTEVCNALSRSLIAEGTADAIWAAFNKLKAAAPTKP